MREGIVGVTGRGSAPSALLIARRATAAPNISVGRRQGGYPAEFGVSGDNVRHVSSLPQQQRTTQTAGDSAKRGYSFQEAMTSPNQEGKLTNAETGAYRVKKIFIY